MRPWVDQQVRRPSLSSHVRAHRASWSDVTSTTCAWPARCVARAADAVPSAPAAGRAIVGGPGRAPPSSAVPEQRSVIARPRPRRPTVATEPASTTDRPARRRRPAGEGQWALGQPEPLNANERTKADDDGLNVRARIENDLRPAGLRLDRPQPTCAAGSAGGASTPSAGPASTAAAPRRSSRTSSTTSTSCCASASTAAASTLAQLRAIADISHDYGRDTADITDRQNIQLHWIRIEDVPGDLAAARGGRPHHHRGVRRHPAGDPRLPGRRRRGRRDHRRHAGDRGDRAPVRRRPGAVQPAAQVQDRDLRLAAPGRRPRGQRHRRSSASCTPSTVPASTSGSAAGCRPTRCSPSASASGSRSTRSPTSGTASSRLFRDYGYRRLRTGPA